jgi:hypothetical protein
MHKTNDYQMIKHTYRNQLVVIVLMASVQNSLILCFALDRNLCHLNHGLIVVDGHLFISYILITCALLTLTMQSIAGRPT